MEFVLLRDIFALLPLKQGTLCLAPVVALGPAAERHVVRELRTGQGESE